MMKNWILFWIGWCMSGLLSVWSVIHTWSDMPDNFVFFIWAAGPTVAIVRIGTIIVYSMGSAIKHLFI
jgi:hypothetical protein